MVKLITPQSFFEALKVQGISFFTGVPDSLLKDFCAYLTDNTDSDNHLIAANEGCAIGLATGHYLATKKPALVYLQNSGLGNAVNPLTSLTDKQVYGIPLLLVIGWRGEPGVQDEPQHMTMGEITPALLDTLGVPYKILDEHFNQQLQDIHTHFENNQSPYALLVKKGTFASYDLQNKPATKGTLLREQALEIVLSHLKKEDIVVSTTGKLSRELFELRKKLNQPSAQDFLTVGSMGHSSSIALGIALSKKNRKVYCLDGDGSLLMHMGSLSTVGNRKPNNFTHLVFNNQVHESVGSQPTTIDTCSVEKLGDACGYAQSVRCETAQEIAQALNNAHQPALIEILVKPGSRKDLGRPTSTPQENKEGFMNHVS